MVFDRPEGGYFSDIEDTNTLELTVMDQNNIYTERRERLRAVLKDKGLPALLVTHAANRYYLSGFELHDAQCNESSGSLLITASGQDWLLTDPRYEVAAQRLWPADRVFIYKTKRSETIGEFLKKHGFSSVGFEPGSVCFESHSVLKEYLALEPVKDLVEGLRITKDAAEIEILRRSCALNHDLMRFVETSLLEPGRTEQEVAWKIEQFFREHGASELAFSSIVAIGPNAALPHARPGSDRVAEGKPLLIDVGARLQGYCSDQTRTFWVGENPSSEFSRTLFQVREAQERAIKAIRPGMTRKDVYGVAYKYFEEQGVADKFNHGLGHGIGLETHEPPSLSSFAEGTLEPGMVVTVEPGLYYPEWGGVRWEYMVYITPDGVEIL